MGKGVVEDTSNTVSRGRGKSAERIGNTTRDVKVPTRERGGFHGGWAKAYTGK